MNLHVVLIIFQIVVLLFAISLHEAAHGWMAWRLGDPTARMLGRVTLNPLRHIDPFGTVLIPLLCVYAGFPLIGWAKPTPVTTRNFKNIKRDDILTTLAGPASNLLTAIAATVILLVLKFINAPTVISAMMAAQMGMIDPNVMNASPILFPITMLLYYAVLLNLILMAFNLIPLPPLDGSHVVRHMLPYNWLRVYDSIGMIGLILIFFFGARFIGMIVSPMLSVFNHILLSM
ncbi:MAG TPA: site-2 protease family protein [Acidobacteriaceae bacterium]|nr:site-2 protease family protein [Terriglobia bacterium]HVC89321.1 site-2 protease family protein [Acidobacteriaceae bacterium]